MPGQVRRRATCLNSGVLQEGTLPRRYSGSLFIRNEEGTVPRAVGLTRPKGSRIYLQWLQYTVRVTGGRGKLHSEELHIFYCFTDAFVFIKSRIIAWVGHVARIDG
jgi:hypothetical protein